MTLQEKLEILGAGARYDVSCASSGVQRGNSGRFSGGLGNSAASGICHSWASDGRCVSLLKVLFTNQCLYDCAYCPNRRSRDIPRTAFTVQELVDLTLGFYRRNMIEGLFLSSGVFGSPDHTMETFLKILQILREREKFFGYIHVKAIPGASEDLIRRVGAYADRMSVNIELPSAESLARLAPDKTPQGIFRPMRVIAVETQGAQEVSRHLAALRGEVAAEPAPEYGVTGAKSRALAAAKAPGKFFVPGGQSTQMIIGASPETDLQILGLSSRLYQGYGLKRVYFSAFIPIGEDPSLPAAGPVPLWREHRLYQADWLMRFYQFAPEELLDDQSPNLDPRLDPKVVWALRHPEFFPVDLQRRPEPDLLRVPGIGPTSVRRLVQGRRHGTLTEEVVKKCGVVWRRARFFVALRGQGPEKSLPMAFLREELSDPGFRPPVNPGPRQQEFQFDLGS